MGRRQRGNKKVMSKLSILICTIPSRYAYYGRLIVELNAQILPYAPEVGIISNNSTELSIGAKRNWLLEKAESEYIAYIDDDDRVSQSYIDLLIQGINKGVDCCSLIGEITFDGKNPKKFIHSMDYEGWYERNDVYYRGVNHLNCIKTSIAKQIGFTDKNHGEDYDFSIKLQESGLLKTEHKIHQTIYYYDYRNKK